MTSGCIYNIAGSHVLNRMLSSIATPATSLIVRPKYLDQTQIWHPASDLNRAPSSVTLPLNQRITTLTGLTWLRWAGLAPAIFWL